MIVVYRLSLEYGELFSGKLSSMRGVCLSMSARLDIIVFGASGFTGKHVIKELIKLQSNSSFTFGVAGRSIQKLQGNMIVFDSII